VYATKSRNLEELRQRIIARRSYWEESLI